MGHEHLPKCLVHSFATILAYSNLNSVLSEFAYVEVHPANVPHACRGAADRGQLDSEIKYDGYRTQVIVEDGTARTITRRGYDWSSTYKTIVEAAATIPKSAIIDGEAIVLNEKGVSDFHSVRSAMRWAPDRIIFVAFDLLHHDGIDLRREPLLARREKLLELVGTAKGVIQYSHHVHGGGADFYAAVDRMGLEGMVSKREESSYRSGDTEAWVKTKCYEEVDFEVAGVQRTPGSAPLALMATRDAERRYVGSANIALTKAMRERLYAKVQEGKGSPPRGADKPDAEWIEPGLVGRVKTLKRENKLRHATLRAIREAKA
ncbi:ATP-dependent DNA ligase [Mesorhizobium sp. M7A.T.Ca.US.000.02.2.1]|uniref:ATP-dependent DNA ligase n=2 Tax=unclassified Mesorhizobium TaxID=325217 RepID=UPI0032AF89F9